MAVTTMTVNKRPTLMALSLELIDHILTFLLWPHDVHPLLLVSKSLNPIAERILYRNIGELPARRAVRLSLSLANATATRCELIKSLSLDFIENRVLFALELLMAKVLKRLPQLRSLSVEVSVHENRHRALAWIFPRDAPSCSACSRLLSGNVTSFIICLYVWWTLNEYPRLDPDLAAFLESQPEIRGLSLRGIPSCASDPFTLLPSALPHLETFRSVHVDPDTLGEVHTCISQRVPHFSVRLMGHTGDRNATRGGHITLLVLRAWIPRPSSSCTNIYPRPAPDDPHRRGIGTERALPTARRTPASSRGTTHSRPCAAIRSRMYTLVFPLSTIPMVTPVLSGEDRTCCWSPRRYLKRSLACGFSCLWLVACRVMSCMTRRQLRSVGRVRARR